MPKINILQLIGSFHQGGSERQAVQLVKLLHNNEKYRVFVACLNKEGVLRGEIEELGYKNFLEFSLNSFYDANMIRQLRRCAKFLRENDIKIVQSSDFYTNVFGMTAGALARVPVRIAAKRETGTKTAKQAFIERRAFNLAHAVVVNADAVKKHLVETGVSENKIYTIYNGLDLERLTVSDDLKQTEILKNFNLPFGEKEKFVTIVANLRSDVKNHKMFLRAARKVSEKVEDVNFILAGEGELTDAMKRFANELGIEDKTFFIGRCAKVAELLEISDVCVLCSKTEGFSNSILEYMAAVKPVVATDVGGASEAIIEGETGFLIQSDDDDALAKRVVELLVNPEKAEKMGAKGRKVVEEKFSVESQTERTLSIYEKLLK